MSELDIDGDDWNNRADWTVIGLSKEEFFVHKGQNDLYDMIS